MGCQPLRAAFQIQHVLGLRTDGLETDEIFQLGDESRAVGSSVTKWTIGRQASPQPFEDQPKAAIHRRIMRLGCDVRRNRSK